MSVSREDPGNRLAREGLETIDRMAIPGGR